jgi:hypothetical protein
MQAKRSLVGNHAPLFRPKPRHDEIRVFAPSKMHQAINAATHTHHPSNAQVMIEQLWRVPGVSRLPRREKPFLVRCRLEQTVP